jgi:hypothetical protein
MYKFLQQLEKKKLLRVCKTVAGMNPSGSYSFVDIPKAEFSDGIISSKSIKESARNIFNVLFK